MSEIMSIEELKIKIKRHLSQINMFLYKEFFLNKENETNYSVFDVETGRKYFTGTLEEILKLYKIE